MSYSVSVSQTHVGLAEAKLREQSAVQPDDQRGDCDAAITAAALVLGLLGDWVNCSIYGHAEPDPRTQRPGWNRPSMTISMVNVDAPEPAPET